MGRLERGPGQRERLLRVTTPPAGRSDHLRREHPRREGRDDREHDDPVPRRAAVEGKCEGGSEYGHGGAGHYVQPLP